MNVALDAEGAVCDLRGLLGNPGVRLCLFTGIYAVEKRFFRRLTPGKVESVVPVLVEMIRETPGSVGSVVVDEGIWRDIGDPEAYDRVKTSGIKLHYDHEDKWVMMTESRTPSATGYRIRPASGMRPVDRLLPVKIRRCKKDLPSMGNSGTVGKFPSTRPLSVRFSVYPRLAI